MRSELMTIWSPPVLWLATCSSCISLLIVFRAMHKATNWAWREPKAGACFQECWQDTAGEVERHVDAGAIDNWISTVVWENSWMRLFFASKLLVSSFTSYFYSLVIAFFNGIREIGKPMGALPKSRQKARPTNNFLENQRLQNTAQAMFLLFIRPQGKNRACFRQARCAFWNLVFY